MSSDDRPEWIKRHLASELPAEFKPGFAALLRGLPERQKVLIEQFPPMCAIKCGCGCGVFGIVIGIQELKKETKVADPKLEFELALTVVDERNEKHWVAPERTVLVGYRNGVTPDVIASMTRCIGDA